ncbi:MAG: SDR family NAD(P)-dependent oxidoreductase [Capsulimonas sp.]|uniref:SDR family oxidoreductase n=1 Tax=Capsulimonas sp. TaxID=2494211 RepID=UPI003265FBD7
MKPSGNTVLITGGATGIGLALARKLIGANNIVIICGRRQSALDAAAAALPGLVTIQADISDSVSRAALAADVTARFPKLNVLINNAGHSRTTGIDDPDFLKTLELEIAVNFFGPVSLSILLLPVLRRQSEATIANVTTGYVYVSSARMAPYSATKTALHSMTQTMRYMLRDTNVRMVEIIPGAHDTDMSSHVKGKKETTENAANTIMRRLAANVPEFLVGIPGVMLFAARLTPNFLFKSLNDGEAKAAEVRL